MANNATKKKVAKTMRLTRSVTGSLAYIKRQYTLNYKEEKPKVFKMQLVRGPVVKDDDIVAYAAQAAHVPETTIRMAKSALFDALNYFTKLGHPVQVPNLGTFSVQTLAKTAKTQAELEESSTELIRRRRIYFYPKVEVRNLCTASALNFVENKGLTKLALAADGLNEDGTPIVPEP